MSTVAKASITLVSISDAYAVSLAPSMCVIHADYDGSHPVLTNAYTLITVYCGEVKVPFTVEMVTASHISINYSLSKIDDCTYRLAITDLHYSLLEGGLDITVKPNDYTTLNGRFLFTVERESTMLDWIQAWESNKTTIGATSIITPKLFVGKKITGSYDSLAEVPGLTGVYIGPSENDSCGLYGYKNSIEIFHLDETGGKIGGWDLSQDGLYSSNGKLRILSDGSIRAVNDEFDTIWEVCADGSASFALGNVKFYANGNAEFKGKITSSEGNIAGWTITDSLLHCVPIALSATGKYIALANISSYPLLADGSWNGNHFNWVQQYGGAALYYTSSSNFGFIAYNKSAKQVFAAGSTNFIAGWSFDETALWIGTKNNNSNQYTGTSGSLTIGSEGLRGSTWYINANGTASFVKGLVTFGEISGTIVGWTLTGSKIATNYIALTSAAGSSGLYMTASANGQFIAKGPDAMENFINDNGGIYLKVSSDSANLGAYNSKGSRLFKIQSNGTCYIAGWSFDETSLWTGTQVTSGFTASGNISIGPNGLRGYKWRLENDGSGALAGGQITWSKDGSGSLANGNITWDKAGNVTFSSSVSLNWQSGINAAQESADDAYNEAILAQDAAIASSNKASIAQMIAFGQMLYRDPEFTQDKKNGTAIYAYGSFDYCTFSASQLAIAMRDFGLLLKGNACVTRVDLIHSDGTITTVFTGSVQTNTETTTNLRGPITNTVESDTVRILYTGEDAWLQAEAYDDDSISLGWLALCGSGNILGKQYINTSRALVSDTTAPNSTQQVVQFTNTRWITNSDFRLGGFLFSNKSRANGKFVVKIVAKIPVGWKIENYHNSYGNGAKTEWVTSQNGTGEYTEYICVVTCGTTGTFSTINHFALKCGDGFTGVAGENEFATGIKREKESAGYFAESVVWYVAYATVFDATSSDKVTTTIDAHGIYTGTLRADQIIAGTIDATKISADVILSNGNAWALNKDGSGYLANKNISWDKDGNTSFNGKIKATSGEISQFSINNQGLYYGDISKWTETGETNMSQIGPNFVRMEQAVGYSQAGDIAYQKIGIGAGSDPTQSFESDKYCGSALYIYRKMNSISDWYFPAAQIISDNVINRNIGLRIVGGLQVHGGIIEKGYVVTLTDSGGASFLDLSFGTTFLLINSASSSRDFFFPTLSNLRQQLGITDTTESFCVPITIICGSSSNNCAISAASAASNSPGKAEGGSIVNNNGAWDYKNSDSYGANRMALAKGDCWIFALVFTPNTGYYIQIISAHT